MIKRYKDLDNQLQNTTFEYVLYYLKTSSNEHNGSNAKCHEWYG
jgi:hypothetical protein